MDELSILFITSLVATGYVAIDTILAIAISNLYTNEPITSATEVKPNYITKSKPVTGSLVEVVRQGLVRGVGSPNDDK